MEEKLQTTQKNTDEWQSKHRLLQDDLNTLEIALTQVGYCFCNKMEIYLVFSPREHVLP